MVQSSVADPDPGSGIQDPGLGAFCSVVDPYSFFPDPDPEFDVGDQYGSNTDPGL